MVHQRPKKTWPSAALLLCALGVGGPWGCQGHYRKVVELADGGTPRAPDRRLLSVTVHLDADANDDSPVALSLLLVYEPALARRLRGLTAEQWFEAREQVLRDARGTLDEVLWEFIPGQEVPEYTRPLRPQPAEGLLFVRYGKGGPHLYPFDPERPMSLELRNREVLVSQEQEQEQP